MEREKLTINEIGIVTTHEAYNLQNTKAANGIFGGRYLEIKKVSKELKYKTAAVPLIRLFCKSCGKCAA